MKTTEEQKKDKDGYQLIPESFSSLGYDFKLIKRYDNNWELYELTKENSRPIYELILPRRCEEAVIQGNVIPKKWGYPGTTQFGRYGFAVVSPERADEKVKELIERKKQSAQPRQEKIIDINKPKGKRGRKPVLKPCSKCGVQIYTSVYNRNKGVCDGCI